MDSIEDRVLALETRVDELAVDAGHAVNLGITASREALIAREAHQRNIELLNALRSTQAEQGRMLGEHGRMLGEHGRMLGEHGRVLGEHGERLDTIHGKLGELAVGMHAIETLLRRVVEG